MAKLRSSRAVRPAFRGTVRASVIRSFGVGIRGALLVCSCSGWLAFGCESTPAGGGRSGQGGGHGSGGASASTSQGPGSGPGGGGGEGAAGGRDAGPSVESCDGPGTTYFVAIDGSDDNDGSSNLPFATLEKGAAKLTPGDTLCVRAGTYSAQLTQIPAGTSWDLPVRIMAHPGEAVTVTAPPGGVRPFTLEETSYVVITGVVIDGNDAPYEAVRIGAAAHHVRLAHGEVKRAGRSGVDCGGSDNEFVDVDLHDNGASPLDHGIYIGGARNLVERCSVHGNAGYGVHVYNGSSPTADENVVRSSLIFDGGKDGIDGGTGLIVSSGTGSRVYNNVFWGNRVAVYVNYDATGALIANNVIVDDVGDAPILVGDGSNGAIVENNILFGNAGVLLDTGKSTTSDHNLTDVDPSFANPAAHDYHLLPGSAAIDAGTAVAAVTEDFDGVPRPQGAAYDIGAFEL